MKKRIWIFIFFLEHKKWGRGHWEARSVFKMWVIESYLELKVIKTNEDKVFIILHIKALFSSS